MQVANSQFYDSWQDKALSMLTEKVYTDNGKTCVNRA